MPSRFSSIRKFLAKGKFAHNRPENEGRSDLVQDNLESIGTLEAQSAHPPRLVPESVILSEPRLGSDHGATLIYNEAGLNHLQYPSSNTCSRDQLQDESEEHQATISLFSNPRYFTVQNSRFTAHSHTTNIKYANGTTALDMLLSRASHSAAYNSKDRSFDTPKCDEDTRVGLVEEIMDWAQAEEVPSRLLCLTGSAGSGKSALAQTTSETCAKKGCLGATFFFSVTDPQRNNTDRFVASLAYQLSRSMTVVEKHILRAVEKDPAIFEMSMETQAEVLLINPVLNVARGSKSKKTWIIVVDGVDECIGEEHQAQVLRVLHFCGDPNLPFRIFVTSRPEYAMRSALAPIGHLNTAYHIVLNEHDATADIRLYLRRRLGEMGKAKGDDHWPSDGLLDTLVNGASGQFIYAATVVKFVGDRRCSPFRRLQEYLDWTSKPFNRHNRNPFAFLDALYTKILSTAQAAYEEAFEGEGDCPSLTQRLMSFMVMADICTIEGKAFTEIKAIECVLQWDDGECYRLVEDLHSVAQVKPDVSRNGFRVSFYHKSFLDYLLDSTRSQSFHVHPEVLFADLTAKALAHIIAVDVNDMPTGALRRAGTAGVHWSKASLDVALLAWPHLLPFALMVDHSEPVYDQISEAIFRLFGTAGAWDKLVKIARSGFKSAAYSKGLRNLRSITQSNISSPILAACQAYPIQTTTAQDGRVVFDERDGPPKRRDPPTPVLFYPLCERLQPMLLGHDLRSSNQSETPSQAFSQEGEFMFLYHFPFVSAPRSQGRSCSGSTRPRRSSPLGLSRD